MRHTKTLSTLGEVIGLGYRRKKKNSTFIQLLRGREF